MNVTQNEVKSMTPASNQAVQRQYAKQSGIAVGEAFAEAMIKASEGLCNRAQLKRILEQPPEAIKNSLDAVIHTFKTHISVIKPEGVTAAELKPVDKSYYQVLSNLKSQCSTVLKAGIAGHTEKLINATSWQEIVGVAREAVSGKEKKKTKASELNEEKLMTWFNKEHPRMTTNAMMLLINLCKGTLEMRTLRAAEANEKAVAKREKKEAKAKGKTEPVVQA